MDENEMLEYVVDFRGVKTHWYFFEAVVKGMEFRAGCGRNLSAVWDLLTGDIEFPATVYFRGTETLPEDLHDLRDRVLKEFYDTIDYFDDGDQKLKIVIVD